MFGSSMLLGRLPFLCPKGVGFQRPPPPKKKKIGTSYKLTCAHTLWETATKFCMVIKLCARKKMYGPPRMLTRDLFAVSSFQKRCSIITGRKCQTQGTHTVNKGWTKIMTLHLNVQQCVFLLFLAFAFMFVRSFVSSFVPSFVPSFLSSFLPFFLPSLISSFLPSFLPVRQNRAPYFAKNERKRLSHAAYWTDRTARRIYVTQALSSIFLFYN